MGSNLNESAAMASQISVGASNGHDVFREEARERTGAGAAAQSLHSEDNSLPSIP